MAAFDFSPKVKRSTGRNLPMRPLVVRVVAGCAGTMASGARYRCPEVPRLKGFVTYVGDYREQGNRQLWPARPCPKALISLTFRHRRVCLSLKPPFRGSYGERLVAADQTYGKKPRASGEDQQTLFLARQPEWHAGFAQS